MKLNLKECQFWTKDIADKRAMYIQDKDNNFYSVRFDNGKVQRRPDIKIADCMWEGATISDCKKAMKMDYSF